MLPALLSPLVSIHTQLSGIPVGAVRLSSATPSPNPSASETATPTPEPTSSGALGNLPGADVIDSAIDELKTEAAANCLPTDISVCGVVVRFTGNELLGQILNVVLGTPLRLLLIIGFGLLVRRILHRLIDGLSERIATGAANATPSATASTGVGTGGTTEPGTPEPGAPERGAPARGGPEPGATEPGVQERSGPRRGTTPTIVPAGTAPTPLLNTRRQARSRTLAQVLRSITTIAIFVLVTLMGLQELGFPVGPLLAGASIFGVALGFGAQSLVRDVVSGMFMIVEDQYGVGDVVDVGAASGSVEAVGLRITRLRDVNGTVWYVRNGEILRVGNQSQGWARAVLDVNVGYNEDIDHAEEVLLETAEGLRADARFSALVIDEPEVWGVEAMTTDGVVMRVVIKTQPMQQWLVARELRRRIKMRFDQEGIEMRTMPRTVIVNGDDEPEPRSAAGSDALDH